MFGGYAMGSVPGSDSAHPMLSNDLFVFNPDTMAWAYVLGSFGPDVDASSGRFPAAQVVSQSALQWKASGETPVLQVHSSTALIPHDPAMWIDFNTPLRLDPLQHPEWWLYDILSHSFSRLDSTTPIPNSVAHRGAWAASLRGQEFLYALQLGQVSISTASGGFQSAIPVSNWPFPASISMPEMWVIEVISTGTSVRALVRGVIANKLVQGFIEHDNSRATFSPTTQAAGPRATISPFVWPHPSGGTVVMDGRLAYAFPMWGTEMWRRV